MTSDATIKAFSMVFVELASAYEYKMLPTSTDMVLYGVLTNATDTSLLNYIKVYICMYTGITPA